MLWSSLQKFQTRSSLSSLSIAKSRIFDCVSRWAFGAIFSFVQGAFQFMLPRWSDHISQEDFNLWWHLWCKWSNHRSEKWRRQAFTFLELISGHRTGLLMDDQNVCDKWIYLGISCGHVPHVAFQEKMVASLQVKRPAIQNDSRNQVWRSPNGSHETSKIVQEPKWHFGSRLLWFLSSTINSHVFFQFAFRLKIQNSPFFLHWQK